MGRRPQIRASYVNDAQFLLRLEKAVAADGKRPAEWRQKITALISQLAIELLRAPNGS